MRLTRAGLGVVVAAATSGIAFASAPGVPPDHGFDFVTIGARGNAVYSSPDFSLVNGRGSVAYNFRIARDEMTTGQWMEFVNALVDSSPVPRDFAFPLSWGAQRIPFTNHYRLRADIKQASSVGVSGISIFNAAMYCNWLQNGKPTSYSQALTGAYDLRDFDPSVGRIERSPGAQYWIPSLDEWLKASHFDPDRYGEGLPGWWAQPNASDVPLVPGPPGVGETGVGWDASTLERLLLPVGSYGDVVSPWGLRDLSGGEMEWTDTLWPAMFGDRVLYYLDGSSVRFDFFAEADHIDQIWARDAFAGGTLRIASAVPATMSIVPLMMWACFERRKR